MSGLSLWMAIANVKTLAIVIFSLSANEGKVYECH